MMILLRAIVMILLRAILADGGAVELETES
jgi:hypothetical protein